MLFNACSRFFAALLATATPITVLMALAISLQLTGCGEWQPADDDSAMEDGRMVITFTQSFGTAELCFDFDGEGVGWITGCGHDLELYLVVENEVVQEGSEMSMSGSDTLTIDNVPYGPAAQATAPLVGEFDPFGSPFGPCFSGRPHHPSDEVSIWLSVWGGFTQRELHLAVRLGGETEAFGMLQTEGSLDPAFELDQDAGEVNDSCRPPQRYLDELAGDGKSAEKEDEGEDITPSP